jgi:cell division protein FtsW
MTTTSRSNPRGGRSKSSVAKSSVPRSSSARAVAPATPAGVTSLLTRRAVDLDVPFEDDPKPRGRRLLSNKPPGRRSKTFLTILALVTVLNLIGLAMVLSASSVTSLEDTGSPWAQFLRQLLWCALGVVGMVIAMRRDYRRWSRHSGYGVLAILALLFLVMVPHVGVKVNGATRWLGVGQFTIQPAELAKLALIVFWADLLSRRAKWIDDARLTFLPVVLTFLVTGALIMAQPNLGTTTIIFFIMIAMLFVGGTPIRWIAVVIASGGAAAAAFALLFPWRAARLEAFQHPWEHSQDAGFQTLNALAVVANGGPTGTGLGQGRSKWGFLPEANTDFIFAVIAEETGLIGALIVIALFIGLAFTGVRVAMHAPDRFGMLLATGITTWFLVQAFLNIGQSIGSLPVMGVPLPFVSSGGSSLVVSMVAVGMLLNVARQTRA